MIASTRKFFALITLFMLLCADSGWSQQASTSPIHAEMARDNFATMINDNHPENRIGYRFHEHEPLTYGKVPYTNKQAVKHSQRAKRLLEKFKGQDNLVTYTRQLEQSEHWIRQNWNFYLLPVEDGVELLLIVETYQEGLPEYYGIQQCFRMSGITNEPWRKEIAKTPAFSEYDLWEKLGGPQKSLSYVYRNGNWQTLPPTEEAVGARTPLGLTMDEFRTNGTLMEKVGPYKAQMLEPIDYGLVTRVNEEETWVSGIYWENTSHVTDHHPADCLHAIVNIGGIPPHSRKAIRGKIYWFQGSKEDLLRHFREDFPGADN